MQPKVEGWYLITVITKDPEKLRNEIVKATMRDATLTVGDLAIADIKEYADLMPATFAEVSGTLKE